MDGTLHTRSVHSHGRLRNSTPRDCVVADLGVLRPADENGAVRGCAVEFASPERASANESLPDDVVDDLDAIGVTDEDRVVVRIIDLIPLYRNIPILEVVLKSLRALGQRH